MRAQNAGFLSVCSLATCLVYRPRHCSEWRTRDVYKVAEDQRLRSPTLVLKKLQNKRQTDNFLFSSSSQQYNALYIGVCFKNISFPRRCIGCVMSKVPSFHAVYRPTCHRVYVRRLCFVWHVARTRTLPECADATIACNKDMFQIKTKQNKTVLSS